MWPLACVFVASTLSIGRFPPRISSPRDRCVPVFELGNRNALRFLVRCPGFCTLLLVSSSSPSDRGSCASGVPVAAVRHLYREAVLASGDLAEIRRALQRRRRLYAFLVCGSALLVLVNTLLGSTILSLVASGGLIVSFVALVRSQLACDAPALADLLSDWNRYRDRVCELRSVGIGQPVDAILLPEHAALAVELNGVAAGLRARSTAVLGLSFSASEYFDS